MDYGFTHAGKVFTPNQTPDITPADNDTRNKTIEAAELARWHAQPDRMLAYYTFPAEELPLFGKPRPYRRDFRPCLRTFVNQATAADPGVAHVAAVTTWLGTTLGVITDAHVYRHNFGGRFVSLTVKATNGAIYHGRASYDGGSCVLLRKAKGRR